MLLEKSNYEKLSMLERETGKSIDVLINEILEVHLNECSNEDIQQKKVEDALSKLFTEYKTRQETKRNNK